MALCVFTNQVVAVLVATTSTARLTTEIVKMEVSVGKAIKAIKAISPGFGGL